MRKRAVVETITAHTNERHVILGLQYEHTSSNAYRMPPRGAWKAAAMPATAPMPTHPRWAAAAAARACRRAADLEVRDARRHDGADVHHRPSLPRGNPVATTRVIPRVLATNVRHVRKPGTSAPLRLDLTWGGRACRRRLPRGQPRRQRRHATRSPMYAHAAPATLRVEGACAAERIALWSWVTPTTMPAACREGDADGEHHQCRRHSQRNAAVRRAQRPHLKVDLRLLDVRRVRLDTCQLHSPLDEFGPLLSVRAASQPSRAHGLHRFERTLRRLTLSSAVRCGLPLHLAGGCSMSACMAQWQPLCRTWVGRL